MAKILIVAGEPSGDLHASNLVRNLKTLNPGLRFFGLGGTLSKSAGVEVLFDISKLALVGLTDVLRNILTVKKARDAIIARIDTEKPDIAILVDYPGFNLRLAKELKKRSIPVVYYISPQVWAWGKNRIEIIKHCVKKIVVFFKFEKDLYKKCGVDAEFVGHPILDTIKPGLAKEEILKRYGLSGARPVIALVPGSRVSEIKLLLPVMVSAAEIIRRDLESARFIVTKHPDLPKEIFDGIIGTSGLDIRIANGDMHNTLNAADFAIVASGTATLETAIIGAPFLVIYKASLITYLLYKFVRLIPYLCIVNVIANKEVVPEFLQFSATPENIAAKAVEILSDTAKKDKILKGLADVRSSLGSPGASFRAAKAILPLIQ